MAEQAAMGGDAQARVEELEAALAAAQEQIKALEERVRTANQVNLRLAAERRELSEKIAQGGDPAQRLQLDRRIAELETERQNHLESIRELQGWAASYQRDNEDLRAEIAELRARSQTLASEIALLERERMDAIQSANDSRRELERVSAALAAAEARASEAEMDLEILRGELSANVRATEQMQSTLAQHGVTPAPPSTLAADYEALRSMVEGIEAERAELAGAAAAARREAEEARRSCRGHAERIAALEAEVERMRAEREKAGSELQRLRMARGGSASELIRESELARQELEHSLEEERRRHFEARALLEQAEYERQRLQAALEEEQRSGVATIARLSAEIDRLRAGGEQPSASEEESAPSPSDRSTSADSAPRDFWIIDEPDTAKVLARQLKRFQYHAHVVDPKTYDFSPADAPLACASINLAHPESWAVIRTARSSNGLSVPFVAYVLARNAGNGFWLGRVHFLSSAGADLATRLRPMVSELSRAIVLGQDPGVVGALSSELTVHVARSASDLPHTYLTLRPHIAVVSRTPEPEEAFRMVGELRSLDMQIPIVFLLDQEMAAHSDQVLSGAACALLPSGTLKPNELPNLLAAAFSATLSRRHRE